MRSIQYDIRLIKKDNVIDDLMLLIFELPELKDVDRETITPVAKFENNSIRLIFDGFVSVTLLSIPDEVNAFIKANKSVLLVETLSDRLENYTVAIV